VTWATERTSRSRENKGELVGIFGIGLVLAQVVAVVTALEIDTEQRGPPLSDAFSRAFREN
jgi:hypothetical protein